MGAVMGVGGGKGTQNLWQLLFLSLSLSLSPLSLSLSPAIPLVKGNTS